MPERMPSSAAAALLPRRRVGRKLIRGVWSSSRYAAFGAPRWTARRGEAAGGYPCRPALLRAARPTRRFAECALGCYLCARLHRALRRCRAPAFRIEPHQRPLLPLRSALWTRLLAGAGVLFGTLALSTADARQLMAQQAPAPAAASADSTLNLAPYRSPRGAFIRSVLLPGWGQAWVGSPGRGSVYFALEASSGWMLYKTQSRLTDARRRLDFLENIQVTAGGDTTALHDARGLVKSRTQQRESWIALGIFILFFAGADAYVAAQLADFEERIAIQPAPDGGFSVRAQLPVGARR